jgi:hypothetical protein
MTKPYKLTEEIKQFVIEQKNKNPKLSCRGLIPLIREHFRVSLSKSLINNVIKQNNLSSPVGRRGIKEPIIVKQPIETQKVIKKEEIVQPVKTAAGLIEQGGYFFLQAAELKLSFTVNLAENLSAHFPGLSLQSFKALLEAYIFLPIFNNRESLWLFMGREIPQDSLEQYLQQLAKVSLTELNQAVMKSGISHNINNFNELQKQIIMHLSSYAQGNFFPSVYQFLGLREMQERFYSLWANINRTEKFLDIQLFYPEGFLWKNDVVWQEDLTYAINRVNASQVLNQRGAQFRISTQVNILPVNML